MRSRLALTAFRALLGRRLPTTEGVLEVPGAADRITIRRDRYGIPHVTASGDADAWYGLGFAQGQDRAFQIESLVRVVRGTTAAIVGADTLALDRLSRRIGFLEAGARTWDLLDADDRIAMDSFARGVNDGRDIGARRLPHEFALLRARPSTIAGTDIAGMLALQAFALAANWDSELARLEILAADGPEALAAVDPGYPEWHPATEALEVPAGAPVEALRAGLDLLQEVTTLGGGSNNWALAPGRTSTGRALVANDTHLAPSLPPHWYLAHVSTPEWGLAGGAFVGTPAFMSAHNGHVAWGVTAGLVDNTDLFLEEIGPDGASVRRGDGFVRCEVRDETIEIKGAEPAIEQVLVTPEGPVVGPALAGTSDAITMAATWLKPQRATALSSLGRSRTVQDLRDALSRFSGPTLNFAAADDSGAIMWQLAGEAPKRRSGRGAVPLPAWHDEVGWEPEYLPFDVMPHVIDPPGGMVASANTRPTASEEPFLGVDWIEGYRLSRIVDVIGSRRDWDVSSTLRAQLDTVTPSWAELKEHVLSARRVDGTTTSLALLERWDGDVAPTSSAASVFVLWLTGMQRRVAAAAAPNSVDAVLGKGFAPAGLPPNSMFAFNRTGHLVRLLRDRPEGWFGSWEDQITEALAEAEAILRNRAGGDPTDWQWGRMRPLTLSHPVGGRPPMDKIFNLGPIAFGGDFTTMAQAGAPPLDPLGNPSAIPSIRMAVDVGEWDNARFALPGGQSGNPLSPHYDDQLDAWLKGEGLPMPWSDRAVNTAIKEVLHLVPGAV